MAALGARDRGWLTNIALGSGTGWVSDLVHLSSLICSLMQPSWRPHLMLCQDRGTGAGPSASERWLCHCCVTLGKWLGLSELSLIPQ